MAEFIKSIGHILNIEGSEYTNIPGDPGGPTKFGVTQRMLSIKRGTPCTPEDVENLKQDEAEVVYFMYFWMPLKLTGVNNQGMATAIFDIAVNEPMSMVVRFAQIACCICGVAVTADGRVGDHTTGALNAVDPKAFMSAFQKQVIEHYEDIVRKNPVKQKFLHGWLNRANKLSDLIR